MSLGLALLAVPGHVGREIEAMEVSPPIKPTSSPRGLFRFPGALPLRRGGVPLGAPAGPQTPASAHTSRQAFFGFQSKPLPNEGRRCRTWYHRESRQDGHRRQPGMEGLLLGRADRSGCGSRQLRTAAERRPGEPRQLRFGSRRESIRGINPERESDPKAAPPGRGGCRWPLAG